MAKKPILTIISAVHNEVDVIGAFIEECYKEIGKEIPFRMIIAEDGSTDGTKELLFKLKKKYPLVLILGKKRKGLQRAITDALKEVRTPLAFHSDPDQFDPKDFWKLYKKIGHYDLIIGKKIKRRDPPHRKFIGWGHSKIVRYMFDLPLSDMDSGFRLMKNEVIKDILPTVKTLKYGFNTEFVIRAHAKGYRVTEVPVIHTLRIGGTGTTRSFPLWKLPYIIIRQFLSLIKLKYELRNVSR